MGAKNQGQNPNTLTPDPGSLFVFTLKGDYVCRQWFTRRLASPVFTRECKLPFSVLQLRRCFKGQGIAGMRRRGRKAPAV